MVHWPLSERFQTKILKVHILLMICHKQGSLSQEVWIHSSKAFSLKRIQFGLKRKVKTRMNHFLFKITIIDSGLTWRNQGKHHRLCIALSNWMHKLKHKLKCKHYTRFRWPAEKYKVFAFRWEDVPCVLCNSHANTLKILWEVSYFQKW